MMFPFEETEEETQEENLYIPRNMELILRQGNFPEDGRRIRCASCVGVVGVKNTTLSVLYLFRRLWTGI